MAASSSSAGSSYIEEQAAHAAGSAEYDIFLSHSGAQKGFVKGLHKMLHPLYSVFFDITLYSLPPADNFRTHIFKAAKTCRLALVVLSHEFLSSKWPMLELSTFVDAGVKILPLFYKLSPTGLKDKEKLQGWHKKWEEFASEDDRINVSTWDHARRTLCSNNGLIFNESDGELAYLEEIVAAIPRILPPLIKSTHPGIRGKDRLCQVIINRFEELESRHHPAKVCKFEELESIHHPAKVCVLGLYGLPGSGKSTLSTCLRDHFYDLFAGKVLHLEVSIDPTPTELVNKSKELLRLTDFHDTMDLSNTQLDLAQVYSILKRSNLRSSRVFLVLDNISTNSIELVEAILGLGLRAGSRVMLVAQTLEVLRPLLYTPHYKGHHLYVCDSMRVPSINEEEAIRILMQPGGGLGIAEDTNEAEDELSPKHKEIMVKVVRMCAFHDHDQGLLYLPFVLKLMGCQLRSFGMDLEMWERQLRSLEVTVETFKEDAVRKIVENSYEKLLDEKLKLLFLDVALFIVPYSHHISVYSRHCNIDYEESVLELLSCMRESNPEEIKFQIQTLIRLCFLERDFIVHDVFLGFAKRVSGASSMYYCKGRTLNMNADVQISELRSKSKAGLRAVILELDEKCERFDFPAGFASVKVLVVRNCKMLTVLGLEGLTSLVSLEVQNCPSLNRVELGSGADQNHLDSLKSVKWANVKRTYNGLREEENEHKLALSYRRPQRPWNGVIGLASQVRGLQILRLERTGITCLGDASSCWPQLRVLEVLEDRLEQIELGILPNLKRFFFGDAERQFFVHVNYRNLNRSELRMPRQTNLLVGCPELEDVRICQPACEDAGMGTLQSNLRTLHLKHVHHAAPMLPGLTSAAQSLEVLVVYDNWDLRSVDFPCQFSSLVQISLWSCDSLAKITGLEGLPNLRDLDVHNCHSLVSLTSNLENLSMLERLRLFDCPMLNVQLSGLDKWVSLETFEVGDCPNVQFLLRDLANLTKLRSIRCRPVHSFQCFFNIRNLVNLKKLTLDGDENCEEELTQLSLCREYEVNCETSSTASQMKCLPSLLIAGPSHHLSVLKLSGVKNLVSLHGIEFLRNLEHLWMHDLPILTCLQGIECLIHLQSLEMSACMSVEALPSLRTLVNVKTLSVENCVNLKALEGCDAMTSLGQVDLSGCKQLERLPFMNLQDVYSLYFTGCKFASVKAMVAWVLDEEAPEAVLTASAKALVWEFTDHLLEKPTERMDLGVVLVQTLGVYLSRRMKVNDDYYFDFENWVSDLEWAWKSSKSWKSVDFPSALVELMRSMGKVPLNHLLQQCQSDAQFQLSVVHCFAETDHELLDFWVSSYLDE